MYRQSKNSGIRMVIEEGPPEALRRAFNEVEGSHLLMQRSKSV